MEETLALSPVDSMDCFSDTELDIDGPPAVGSYTGTIDETLDASECLVNVASKLEDVIDVKISSNCMSSNETRDVEQSSMNDGNDFGNEARDSDTIVNDTLVTEAVVIEDPANEPELSIQPKNSQAAEMPDVPVLMEQTEDKVQSTTKSFESANWPIASKLESTTKSFESANWPIVSKLESTTKSFESANWPIAISRSSFINNDGSVKIRPAQSDVIPASATDKSNRVDSTEPLEEISELKKPSVSFADEASLLDNVTIERKDSNSSKRSIKSRLSLFSSRKLKDSASMRSSKSAPPTVPLKFNKPPMVPRPAKPSIVEEVNSAFIMDGNQSSLVVVGLAKNDDSKPEAGNIAAVDEKLSIVSPDQTGNDMSLKAETAATVEHSGNDMSMKAESSTCDGSVPRRSSIKSQRSKSSVKSVKSSGTNDLKKSPFATSPRLFGPPQQLKQWDGILKPEVAEVASLELELAVDQSEERNGVAALPVLQNEFITSLVVDTLPMDEAAQVATNELEAPTDLQTQAAENILSPPQSPALFGPPGRLLPSLSNKSYSSKHDGDFAPDDDEVVGERLLDATSTLTSKSSKQLDEEESSETAHSKRSKASNHDLSEKKHLSETEQIFNQTPPEQNLEKDTKQLNVEVNNVANAPIEDVMKPFSPIGIPVCTTIEDSIWKDTAESPKVGKISSENHREDENIDHAVPDEKSNLNLRRMFIRPKSGKAPNPKDTVVIQTKENKVATPASKSTSFFSTLLSPKHLSIQPHESAIEVTAPSTVLNASPKRRGIFHRSQLRSPKASKNGTSVTDSNLETLDGINVNSSLFPMVNVPVEDPSNRFNIKSNAEPDKTHCMKKLDVDMGNVDVLKEGEQYITKDQVKVQISKAHQTRQPINFFRKPKASNETKRQIAKNFNKDLRTAKPKTKELEVKLSANIDEKIFVENLQVSCAETSPGELKSKANIPGLSIRNSVKNVPLVEEKKTVETSVKMDNKSAPIIVVDHRSSKKIEAIGKFDNESAEVLAKEPQVTKQKEYLPKIKESHISNDDENSRLYTSDDTVTDTELTEVAKVVVPLENEKVSMGTSSTKDGNVDCVSTETSGVGSSVTGQNKDKQKTDTTETAWIASFLDWCTPKASAGKDTWMNCSGEEVKVYTTEAQVEDSNKKDESALLDEVISEFNECHDFYTAGLNMKPNATVTAGHCGSQIIEWMSPKTRQVVDETTEQVIDEPEKALPDEKEINVPVSQLEEKISENLDHEGTEIALTNFTLPAENRLFKGLFGKSFRTSVKPTTAATRQKNARAVASETILESSKCEKKNRVNLLRTIFRNKKNLTEQSTVNEGKVAVEMAKIDSAPESSLKVQMKRADPPKATLFTFTSDDCTSEAPQPTIVEKIDDEVVSSVNYLVMVKSKRQSRKQKIENAQDIIDDLIKDKPVEKVKQSENDAEYHYRVNAVSDEALEDIKSSISETTGGSFLSSTLEIEDKVSPALPTKPSENIRDKKGAKGMQSTRATRFPYRRKEEDSVGVSVNSGINSYNDDLSVAFAPAVGKWLW